MRTLEDMVINEVHYCVSTLISELSKLEVCQEELLGIICQDDWESSVRHEVSMWTRDELEDFFNAELSDVSTTVLRSTVIMLIGYGNNWQPSCEEHGWEPNQVEAYEHWIISDWLARKLEEKGQMVAEIFGLTIWGRTCSGQSITMDSVIQEIHRELGE